MGEENNDKIKDIRGIAIPDDDDNVYICIRGSQINTSNDDNKNNKISKQQEGSNMTDDKQDGSGDDFSSLNQGWEELAEGYAGAADASRGNGTSTTTQAPKETVSETPTEAASDASGISDDLRKKYTTRTGNGGNDNQGRPFTDAAKDLGLLDGIDIPNIETAVNTLDQATDKTDDFVAQRMAFLKQVKVENYYGTTETFVLKAAQKLGERAYQVAQDWVDHRVEKNLIDMVRSDLEEQAEQLRGTVNQYENLLTRLSEQEAKYSERAIVGDAMLTEEVYPELQALKGEITNLHADYQKAASRGDVSGANAAKLELRNKKTELRKKENFYERVDSRVNVASAASKKAQALIERIQLNQSKTEAYVTALEERANTLAIVKDLRTMQDLIEPAYLNGLGVLLSDARGIEGMEGARINETIHRGGDGNANLDLTSDYWSAEAEVARTDDYMRQRSDRIEALHSTRISRMNYAATGTE